MHKALRLPLGILVLVLLVLLAMTGVAYGLWAKTLTIEGEIHTGTLHGKWTGALCTEFHPWPYSIATAVLGEAEGKDVGWFEVEVDPTDDNRLLITAWNAYPSYAVDCQVEFMNDGTIPWKIRGIALSPGQGLTNCIQTGTAQNPALECDQLTVQLMDGIAAQYEPGEVTAESLRFHVEQPAEMGSVYKFFVDVCVGQWNEFATGPACFAASPTN